MANMVLHVDGSLCRASKGSRRTSVGWAVVAHFEGDYCEAHGAQERDLNGCHELLAFVEGVRLADSRGFGPQDVSIYTDDIVLGNAGWFFHPGNCKQSKVDAVTANLRYITRQLYCDATHELVLRYLREARVQWVKGHSFCVDQERADYLARYAARALLGRDEPVKDVWQWLQAGIIYYDATQSARTWYAPFVESMASQPCAG